MSQTAAAFICLILTVANAYQILDPNYIRANAHLIKPARMPIVKKSALQKQMIEVKELNPMSNKVRSAVVQRGDFHDEMFKPMGKLLFMDDRNRTTYCSAQYVAPNLLLTAAHCVYTPEKWRTKTGWFRNYTFIQNYEAADPYNPSEFTGTLRRVEKAIIDKRYYTNLTTGEIVAENGENMKYDFAFISMYDPTISTYHEMGMSDPYSTWTTAGYPSNYAKGEQLHYYKGLKGQTDDRVFGITNVPFGGGCSGGAWLAKKGGRVRVIGLNSFQFQNDYEMFGPRLLNDVINPIRQRAMDVLEKLKNSKCKNNGEDK